MRPLRVGQAPQDRLPGPLAKANTDLLPISAQIPQIMLVIDEGAEILASTDRQHEQARREDPGSDPDRPRHGHPHRAHRARCHRQRAEQPHDPPRGQGARRPHRWRDRGHGPEQDVPRHPRPAASTRPRYKGAGFMGTPESAGRAVQGWRILPTRSARSSPPPPTGTPRSMPCPPRPPGPPTRGAGTPSAPHGCATPHPRPGNREFRQTSHGPVEQRRWLNLSALRARPAAGRRTQRI